MSARRMIAPAGPALLLLLLAGPLAIQALDEYMAPIMPPGDPKTMCHAALLVAVNGFFAEYGATAINATKMAVADFSDDDVGAMVHVYATNCTGSLSAEAITSANAKYGKVISGVIGDWCSGASLGGSVVANKLEIPMISYGSTSPRLTMEGGKYFNRVVPSDVYQGKYLADTLLKDAKKIGIVFTTDAYGESIAHELVLAVTAAGDANRSVVAMYGFSGEWTPNSLTGMLAAGPDAVVLACGSAGGDFSCGDAAKELRAGGFKGGFYGTDTLVNAALLEQEGVATAMEGTKAPALFTGTPAFRMKYMQTTGASDVAQGAAGVYDAVKMFIKFCSYDGKLRSGKAIQSKLTRPGASKTQVLGTGVTGSPVVLDKYGDDATIEFDTYMAKDGVWTRVAE